MGFRPLRRDARPGDRGQVPRGINYFDNVFTRLIEPRRIVAQFAEDEVIGSGLRACLKFRLNSPSGLIVNDGLFAFSFTDPNAPNENRKLGVLMWV